MEGRFTYILSLGFYAIMMGSKDVLLLFACVLFGGLCCLGNLDIKIRNLTYLAEGKLLYLVLLMYEVLESYSFLHSFLLLAYYAV